MKQLLNHRIFIFVVGIISILILIILSTSLDSFNFTKGGVLEFSSFDNNREFQSRPTPEPEWYVIVTVVILSILILISLVFGKPKQIPSILPILLPLIIISLLIGWWISRDNLNIEITQSVTNVSTSISPQESPIPNQEEPESTYIPPKMSPWVSFGFTFSILLSLLVFILFLLRKRSRSQIPLDNIADIAEEAIIHIQSGSDYENIVIECYAKMIMELNNQRSIQRRVDLTPTEFIEVLTQAGVAYDPVHNLTALFERVRYGGKVTSENEINEATVCLTGIVNSIRVNYEKK